MLATVAASEVKVVTNEAAANLAGQLIDLTGGTSAMATLAATGATSRSSLHNPRLYKNQDSGDYYFISALTPTGVLFE